MALEMIKGLFVNYRPHLDKHVEHLYSLVKKRDKYWSRYISIYLTSFHYLIYITFDYSSNPTIKLGWN